MAGSSWWSSIDRASRTGRGKAAIEAASRFVGQLNRADRVALASIPNGPQVTFTADHALVQRRIRDIDGTAVADIGEHNLGVVDAMAFERKNDAAMESVYDRECGNLAAVGRGGSGGGQGEVRICQNTVRLEANVVAADARERARTSIQGLQALIDSLPPSHTPKMLVLISEGLVVDRELSQLSWLEAKAAAAHVTIYSLMLDRSQTDASQRRPEAQPAANRAMRQQGLDFIAQATRGDVFQILSNSDFAFRRLALELSGYYLLGFEPEDRDRGGTAHTIAVTVTRRGVTVRSRRQFRIDPGAAKTLDSQVVAALRDPLPAAEIPVKLATFSFRDPIHDKLRLLIGADIDRSVNPDGQLSAGYVVVDFDGKLAASQMDALQPPAARAGDPALLQHRGRGRRQVHGQARRRRRCRTAGKRGDARGRAFDGSGTPSGNRFTHRRLGREGGHAAARASRRRRHHWPDAVRLHGVVRRRCRCPWPGQRHVGGRVSSRSDECRRTRAARAPAFAGEHSLPHRLRACEHRQNSRQATTSRGRWWRWASMRSGR